MTIYFDENFLINLAKIQDFIANDSINRAIKFKDDLYQKISEIYPFPLRFRKNLLVNKDNVRDLIFKGYVVPFEINDNHIMILTIYKNNLWKPKQ